MKKIRSLICSHISENIFYIKLIKQMLKTYFYFLLLFFTSNGDIHHVSEYLNFSCKTHISTSIKLLFYSCIRVNFSKIRGGNRQKILLLDGIVVVSEVYLFSSSVQGKILLNNINTSIFTNQYFFLDYVYIESIETVYRDTFRDV